MFEVKKGDAFKAYFKLVDSTDFATPENGLANTDVTGAYTKNGAGAVTLDMAAANRWTDLSGDVSGLYVVTVPTGAVDTIGELIVAVIDDGGGIAGAARVFKVVSHPSDDIYNKVSLVYDEVVSIAASVAQARTDIGNLTDIGAAAVEDACSAALQNLRLHQLLASQASLTVGSTTVLVSSVIGKMINKAPGTAWAYALATDSLEALRDNQAAAGGDWTANEKTEFKAILGIKNTGTPGDPTAGILFDDLLDGKVWDVLSTGHVGAGKAGRKMWHKVSQIQSSVAQARTDIAALNDPTEAVIADAVWNELSTGHTDAGKAGRKMWHKVSMIQNSIAQTRTDIGALNDPTAAAVADAVWDEASTGHVAAGKAGYQVWTKVKALSNVAANDINPTVNTISNAVRNIGVAVAGTAIANASSHLMHQAHVTIGETGDFSTVAGSLRLARAGAIGDWTVAADTLTIKDTNGVTQKALTLTPGGGPYTARA